MHIYTDIKTLKIKQRADTYEITCLMDIKIKCITIEYIEGPSFIVVCSSRFIRKQFKKKIGNTKTYLI